MPYKFNPFTENFDYYERGGTPGGSNTQIQFNNSGAFGGATNITYNSALNVFIVEDATLVMKDSSGVQWLVTVDTSGHLVTSVVSSTGPASGSPIGPPPFLWMTYP